MKYHLVNTDMRYVPEAGQACMLQEQRVAAFFDRKEEIDVIERGDVVFLYQNKVGVVAVGVANGKLEKGPWEWEGERREGAAHSQCLDRFRLLEPAINTGTLNAIAANFGGLESLVYRRTRFVLPAEVGQAIYGLASAVGAEPPSTRTAHPGSAT